MKAEENLRQSLRLRRERLYSYMKSRNKSCIPMMEIDQIIYIAMQWLAIRKINYKEFAWSLLRDASVQWLAALRMSDYKEFVSSLLRDTSISAEKVDATSGYIGPVQRLDEELLLWSERGRASMLAFQLCKVNQQDSEMEEILEDFSAFDFDDKVSMGGVESWDKLDLFQHIHDQESFRNVQSLLLLTPLHSAISHPRSVLPNCNSLKCHIYTDVTQNSLKDIDVN